jgi:hypothetical protein
MLSNSPPAYAIKTSDGSGEAPIAARARSSAE